VENTKIKLFAIYCGFIPAFSKSNR